MGILALQPRCVRMCTHVGKRPVRPSRVKMSASGFEHGADAGEETCL